MMFRPGEDLEPGERPRAADPAPPPAAGLAFTRAAEAGGTDRDVLMGYQILLGRDPENSFVIADSKVSPVGAFIRGLMGSGEFQSAVLDKLAGGQALPHEAGGVAPTTEQIDWLFRHVALPADDATALRAAPDWRQWFAILVAVPGFPRSPERGGAVPAAGMTAQAADDGFVLIHIDEPKSGERLAPGMMVRGRGWVIAPSDVVEVAVRLGEALLTHARYGLPRPDIARRFPHYRHVDHCGFGFSVELPAEAALHQASQLVISVRTAGGETGRRALKIESPAAHAAALGADASETWPVRLSVEEAVMAADGTLRVRGWAVSRAGGRSVRAWLGTCDLGEARLGLPRPDIAQIHAEYPDAASSGFVLVCGPSSDSPGAEPGVVRVEVRDASGAMRQVSVPVTRSTLRHLASPSDPAGDGRQEGIGDVGAGGLQLEIDDPPIGNGSVPVIVRGSFTITGWAAAKDGVEQVSVLLDGKLLDHAYLGMRREDIHTAFPDYKGARLSGFTLVLPPGTLPEGAHHIQVLARGAGRAGIVERSFEVFAERLDALQVGSSVRVRLPPAEVAVGLELLRRAGWQRRFVVWIAVEAAGQAGAAALGATLASLRRQAYPRWTWRVQGAAEDAVLGLLAHANDRSSMASPCDAAAASLGDADYLLSLRAGDLLGSDTLLAFAIASAADQAADLLYADDVRIDPAQGRPQPFFKPDWSPDLLLSMNFIGRAWCARADLVQRSGLTSGCSDYAAALLLTEHAARIAHVPRVLFDHAVAGDTRADEHDALSGALRRRGIEAALLPGPVTGTWRVHRTFGGPVGQNSAGIPGLVSIIMPTCGAGDLVRLAIRTIRATTAPKLKGGRPVEIVLLDNTPAGKTATRAWLRRYADVVVDMPGAFNWSRFNNAGARAASGEYLLFLNDDIEAREPGWLEALLELAQRPEVGIVGARLLYPDGKVQHGGLYLARNHARHAFRFANGTNAGPFGIAGVVREMIAVTGACQMIRRAVFEALGGFEEAHSVVNNDLDICLRSWREGFSVVFTPHATLIHHELASRAALEDAYDTARFDGTWRTRFLLGDPFRNPHLKALSDDYAPEQEPAVLLHVGRRGPRPEEVGRILAVKLDHIGDFYTALPALRALRRGFPKARIDLLTAQASAELAHREELVDDIVVFDFFHVRSGEGRKRVEEQAFEGLRARLAPACYDMAIDLRMQPETREVLRYSGAPWLVGYDFEDRFPFLDVSLVWESDTRLVPKRAHISQRLEELVSAALDACRDPCAVTPAGPATPMTVAAMAHLSGEFMSRPIVGVHPGVGNAMRQWPAASFAGLIDLLVSEAGLHVVLLGAEVEAPVADEVMRLVAGKGAVESLVGRVPLAALPDVLRACVLFVGNNSGPQHVAASLGIPTVGVHSAVIDAAEWAPLGAQALAIQRRMVCSPCYLAFPSECPRAMACLNGLRPADVFAACRMLLAGAPKPGHGSAAAASGDARRGKALAKRRRRMVV